LAWEPQYHEPYMKYKTDYTFRKAAKKDPLKQVLRSYFPMEEEKDNRVFGAMDGAIRGNMFRQVQERWMEWQKLFLSIIPFPEISAARAMPLAINAVPNPEVHNGLAIQMIDEVRHSTIQMNLKRLYMNHYIDRGLRTFTPHTITSPETLRAQLDDIRDGAVAFDREEFGLDACCLAAPVRNGAGKPVAALGISMSARCFELERASLEAVLVDVAERASAVFAARELPAISEDPPVLERADVSDLRSRSTTTTLSPVDLREEVSA
jgi:hypothetical protein